MMRQRMIRRTVVVALLGLLLPLAPSAPAQSPGAPGPGGRIVRLDPRVDRLVPAGAVLERIGDGFTWVEGPVWDRRGGYLLFSDIPKNAVYKWAPGSGVPPGSSTFTPIPSGAG